VIDVLARNWGFVALRGAAAIIFGLFALLDPAITLLVLVLVYGAYVFVDGVAAVISVLRGRRQQPHSVAILVSGLAGIIVGVIAFLMPGITAAVFVFLIAAWAIVTGVLQIAAAIRLRREISGEWMLILAGALSVIFGLLLATFPRTGALTLVMWLGAFALVFGVVVLGLAFRLRRWVGRPHADAIPHSA